MTTLVINHTGGLPKHSRSGAALHCPSACACRRVIAEAVAADPFTYTRDYLEKDNADYCKWILDAQKWGGAIELSILAR